MSWTPKYINYIINNKPHQEIDADYWNSLWNLVITSIDNTVAGAESLFETSLFNVKVNGTSLEVEDNAVDIPVASSTDYGVVKVWNPNGHTFPLDVCEIIVGDTKFDMPVVGYDFSSHTFQTINPAWLPEVDASGYPNNHKGVMSVSDKQKLDSIAPNAEVNVQSDWDQVNTSADDYIKNKPDYATASKGGLMSPNHVSKLYSLGVFSFTAEPAPLPGDPNRFSSPSTVTATSLLDGSLLFVKFPTISSTGDVTLSVHKQDVVWGPYIPVTQNALPISPSKLSGRTVLLTLQGTGPSSDGRFEAISFFPDMPTIEGTSPINVDDTTDILVISHEASGVTADTYAAYSYSGGYYIPSFTVDEEGHVTAATNLGTAIQGVRQTSATYGLLSKDDWASAVRSPYSMVNTYVLSAGQTMRTWNIPDPQSSYPYSMSVQDISCFDVSTHEPVMVDWSVDYLYSGASKNNYIKLTVSIGEAYEHDIYVLPIVTYRKLGM